MMLCGKLKKFVYMFLVVVLLFVEVQSLPVFATQEYSTDDLIQYAKDIILWEKKQLNISEKDSLLSGDFLENAGNDNADWFVIAEARLGIHEDYDAYLAQLETNIMQKYETDEKLSSVKATEWHREILAVLSCGGNPMDINGINLVEDGIYGRNSDNSPGLQGINGWVWSLIALDSMQWKTPDNAEFTRENIINEILSQQLSDGGFAFSGESGEADITAMVLQALSPYYNDGKQEKVRNAVNSALEFLSENQLDNGTYETCETTVQVLCALCDLGVDIKNDVRFVKSQNVFDGLISFRNSDGGFSHISGGNSESISSAQALIALSAFTRSENSLRRIFDLSEEFSAVEREQLDEINSRIANLSDETDESTAYDVNGLYNSLSTDFKTYIRDYDNIISISKKYELLLSDRDFIDEMSKNETGIGYIYDVENMQKYTTEFGFTEDDKKAYKSLKNKGVTASDITKIKVLLDKAEGTDELLDKKKIISDLKNMKQQSEEYYNELADINFEIMDGLYPFTNLSDDEKKEVQSLYERVQNLPENDRNSVTGYEELCRVCEEKSSAKTIIIIAIFGGAIIVFTLVLLIRKTFREVEK